MKNICLLILCSGISLAGFSQIKFGVKGGLNVSTYFFDPDPELDIEALASFHIGGFFTYSFTDNIGLQVELLYSGEGGRLTGEGFDDTGLLGGQVDTELKDRYSWLALPLLLKYHAASGLTAEAGLIFNFLLTAKTTSAISNDDTEVAIIQDFDESVNGIDTKLGLGLGYELASGLSFNGRFAFSLSNIYEQEYTDTFGFEGGLGVFQLSVGFPVFAK